MRIGICDDDKNDIEKLKTICAKYFKGKQLNYSIVEFENGSQLLGYCEKEDSERIDLLFLDVEMGEISGIYVKEQVLKCNKVWRIAFISNYRDAVYEAFGLKTIAFIIKPAEYGKIEKWLELVREEYEENDIFRLEGYEKYIPSDVHIEDILYIDGDGNYSRIYVKGKDSILITKKLHEIENMISDIPIIRVHKSRIVNLMNLQIERYDGKHRYYVGDKEITIGRVYKKKFDEVYNRFVMNKIRKRL